MAELKLRKGSPFDIDAESKLEWVPENRAEAAWMAFRGFLTRCREAVAYVLTGH